MKQNNIKVTLIRNSRAKNIF